MSTKINPFESYVHDATHALEVSKTEALDLAKLVVQVPVTNAHQYEQAVTYTKAIKTQYAEYKAQRDTALAPLKQAMSVVESWFKPALDALSAAEGTLKNTMGGFLRAEAEEKRRKEQEAQAALLAGRREDVRALIAEVSAPATAVKGASVREIWHAEVVDANKLPREWLAPNEKALDAFAKATKGKGEIAGVRFYSTDSISIRK